MKHIINMLKLKVKKSHWYEKNINYAQIIILLIVLMIILKPKKYHWVIVIYFNNI